MTQYSLPDLPYDYGALEPVISGQSVQLHHGKHHAAYVKGANVAIEQLDAARDHDDFSKIAALERALAFNISGHVLHSIFWQNLKPNGGGEPDGELDAWEHAYYLQYKHEKAKFFEAVWSLWNWEDVAKRYAVAKTAVTLPIASPRRNVARPS